MLIEESHCLLRVIHCCFFLFRLFRGFRVCCLRAFGVSRASLFLRIFVKEFVGGLLVFLLNVIVLGFSVVQGF